MKYIKFIAPFFILLATFITSASAGLATKPLKIDFYRKDSIVLFMDRGVEDDIVIDGYLLIPDANTYQTIKLETFPHEGGRPIIESVFTENTDEDKDKELIVLVRWEINHAGIGTDGNYYKAYVFDNSVINDDSKFNRLDKTEKIIGEGIDGTREGKRVTFKHKTAEAIRKFLRHSPQ